MAPHFTLQGSPARPLVVDRPLQPSGEIGDPPHVELHRTEVIADGSYFRLECSCGYLSCAFTTYRQAEAHGCEVEYALAVAQERRRRMLSSAAGLSVLR